MSHRSFAETVLSAQSLSLDAVLYQPTFLDQINGLFRFPLGRDYHGKYWGGPRAKRDRRVHRMARYVEEDGNHFFSSDDREYVQPKPTRFTLERIGEKLVRVDVLNPWRRLTPKARRPGADRRARLRAERMAA